MIDFSSSDISNQEAVRAFEALVPDAEQRAAVARALITRPKLVLADEPTGNLDAGNGEQILQLMLDLNRELNTALVVVTHDLSIAHRMQFRWHMHDGILTAET